MAGKRGQPGTGGEGDGKPRELPLPSEVVDELADYLASRGLDRDLKSPSNRGAHLLGKASDIELLAPGLAGKPGAGPRTAPRDGHDGVADSTVYKQLKAFFQRCADTLSLQGDRRGAEQLRRASTHWLRHSHARHAIAAGLPVEAAQRNLGHASITTTAAYLSGPLWGTAEDSGSASG